MPTQGTYFIDTSSFATATNIYTDSGLTTVASNGWYQSGVSFRQLSGGTLGSSVYTCECTTFSSSTIQSTSAAACNATQNQTYYHTGSGSIPALADVCYSDAGQTFLGNGFYKVSSTEYIQITGGSGVISSVSSFSLGTSYSSSASQNSAANACPATVSQTYYHNGVGTTPLVTNVCYTNSCKTSVLGNGYYRLAALSQNYTITVANVGSGNKYYINGVLQTTFAISRGSTYTFNQSNSSNSSHPYRLSTTSDGTHGGGVQYTSGWTTNGGTAGSNLISTFVVPANAPDVLYYYCQYHSGMGGQINIGGTQGTYVQITGSSGVVAVTGTFATGESFTSSANQTNATNACAASINQTYYHNGTAGQPPAATDTCYTDACKTTVLGNGYYKIATTGNGVYMQITGGSGVVSAVTNCPSGLTSYSSSVKGVFNQACPFNGSNPGLTETYYHNGGGSSGTPPSSGDTCYSDTAGTTVLLAGYYNLDSNTGVDNRSYIEIGSSGVVSFGYPQTC